MSCFSPLSAWQVVDRFTGEVSISFKQVLRGTIGLQPLKLPCGQCVGCRKSRSQHWAVRCMHEASLYADNCFVTLTYDDDHVPTGGTLLKSDFQNFMKRLRDKFSSVSIRYFYCGEYGPKLARPHYHALLFNFDFPDKTFWKETSNGNLYRSSILEALWPFGFSLIGALSYESAAYVSSYVSKKLTGDIAVAHYAGKLPEYADMSRCPGIGHGWFNKYKRDVYPSDNVIVNRHPFSPPRYYDKLIENEKPRLLEKLKKRRVVRAKKFESDQTLRRRQDRSACLKAKLNLKKRSFENGI